MTIGKRISFERERRGLSQNKLAKLAKISQSALSDIEAGNNSPRYDSLVIIAKALEVDIACLISGVASDQIEEMMLYTKYILLMDFRSIVFLTKFF